MTEVLVKRKAPGRVLAVDVAAAANMVGTLCKYLGFAALFPTAVAIGYGESFWPLDRKSTRLNSSHVVTSRMPSSA